MHRVHLLYVVGLKTILVVLYKRFVIYPFQSVRISDPGNLQYPLQPFSHVGGSYRIYLILSGSLRENHAKSQKIFGSHFQFEIYFCDQTIALTCRNMVHNIFWCSFAIWGIATPYLCKTKNLPWSFIQNNH